MMHLPVAIAVLIWVILIVIPFWRIFGKAGFSPWLSLLMGIPFLNFLMIWFLAFAQWRDSK